MPQLDISTFPSQIFWLFISFTLLYMVLSRRLLPHIAELVEARQRKIGQDLERAEALRIEAETARRDYEQALMEARQAANKKYRETSDKITRLQEKQVTKMEATLHSQLREAEARISEKCDALEKEMETLSQSIAEDVVKKLTGAAPKKAELNQALKEAEEKHAV